MNIKDFEYAGRCCVCDRELDMCESGFCVVCGNSFCWSYCGDWGDDGHLCYNCKENEDLFDE